MRGFFTGVLGLGSVIPFLMGWGGGGIGYIVLGAAMLILAAIVAGSKPSETTTTSGEDLVAKENNRKVAVKLASEGGMLGIFAGRWVKAYERDPSVPIYGVRPYWTPSGPGGTPQFLTSMGFEGLANRLEYVRQAPVGDSLLPIMADDPHPRVREAVRARLASPTQH